MGYTVKKYYRIHWQDRPSTATAVSATNLNHMDVFLNEVDNALIEMEAAKLNISTANSMIKSIAFDKGKGLMTVKQLDGTTFTFDWNVEKIPVAFSLSEDGILTMTTQDGTQFTANIADLIKDYIFDDSDTIVFTKEFQNIDDSYHVGASVKEGSILGKHLNPDYRAEIQQFSNVAQSAANDSMTYSKDSKRWAVGDAEYMGSETDNAKYYKEQSEAAKREAEAARDEAQAATGNVIMAPNRLGVGKPDNQTIGTEEDGTIKLIAKAVSIPVTDSQGLIGETNTETNTQLLINAIAEKVANQLVTNDALTSKLADYMSKSMLSNEQLNDQNMVPTSALAYAMNQSITQNEEAITQLNRDISDTWGYYQADSFNIDNTSNSILWINAYSDSFLGNHPFQNDHYLLITTSNGHGNSLQVAISINNGIKIRYIIPGSSWEVWH